jgi:hypothetical protein
MVGHAVLIITVATAAHEDPDSRHVNIIRDLGPKFLN